jgi:hypothetical protein
MKTKAEIFFFGIMFLSHFFMIFTLIKQTQDKSYKAGLNQAAVIMTKNVR